MSKAYRIADEQNEIVVRFDKGLIERETLVELLDRIEVESIKKRSQMNEAEIAELAQEVNAAAWQRVKHLFVPDAL